MSGEKRERERKKKESTRGIDSPDGVVARSIRSERSAFKNTLDQLVRESRSDFFDSRTTPCYSRDSRDELKDFVI